LSPTASPLFSASPIDLPSIAQPSSGSMLFSSHGAVQPVTRKSVSRKRSDSQGPLRLSSNLSVTSE
jgi:hypothetical protein